MADNGEIRTDEERVSGGSKEGVVRWVLGISLLLAIVLLSLVWIVPALTQGGEDDASSRVGSPQTEAAPANDSTDSMVDAEDMGEDNGDTTTPTDTTEAEGEELAAE